MTNKLRFAAVSTIISIVLHMYLSSIYYPLTLGLPTTKSECSINATFDCDAVATSAYSSLLGVPLSGWGTVANIMLLLMICVWLFGLSSRSEKWARLTVLFSGGIALASVALGVLSVVALSTYCLFCLSLYVLSFIQFECLRRSANESNLKEIPQDITGLFTKDFKYLAFFAVLPIGSFMLNGIYIKNYSPNATQIAREAELAVQSWKVASTVPLTAKPALVKNPEAKIMIVEFADFLCPHCSATAPALRSFFRGHPDVGMAFYNFPLDGGCNDMIESDRGGQRCILAKATTCAGDLGDGWGLHYELFERQQEFASKDPISIEKALKDMAPKYSISWEEFKSCLDSEDTHKRVLAEAKQGADAQVQGTPTIYVNGKKISHGRTITYLKAIRSAILSGD